MITNRWSNYGAGREPVASCHNLRNLRIVLVAAVFALALAPAAFSQVATGMPPFSSFSTGPFSAVNNANLNVRFAIPIVRKAGRGLPFSYSLIHDSSMWSPSSSSGAMTWTPDPLWGWHGTEAATGYSYVPTSTTGGFHFQYGMGQCSSGAYYFTFYDWVYTDPQGTSHAFSPSFSVQETNSQCPDVQSTWGTTVATDGSGYSLCADATNANHCTSSSEYMPAAAVTAPSGIVYSPFIWGSGTVKDTNGNTIDASATDNYTDTLGTTPVTVTGALPQKLYYKYSNPQGGTSTYTAIFTQFTVETNFGCSGVAEFGASQQTQEYLVSEIDLPDGSKYTFFYEPTPSPNFPGAVTGRIASVTLPTGGTISYSYSGGTNDGINCSDGSTDYLQRTTPDGTWTYTHSENGSAWTTIAIDPQGDWTVYDFQNGYETERDIHQGRFTLLETIYTCYNGASAPCNSTAVSLPITQVAVTTVTDNGLQAKTSTDYNPYGLPTEVEDYGYGSGAPGGLYRKTLIAYAALSNPNIQDRPQSVTIETGSGGMAAQTTYSYDGNGNLTTLSENTGSGTISRSFTYGTGGVMQTATDFAGNPTTFTNGACNGAFPTSIAQSLGLTTTIIWDNGAQQCETALVTSVTDPNSQPTSFSYDEFDRLTQTNYPGGGQVSTAYNDTSSPLNVVTTTKLNSSQNRTDTALIDGLGRVTETQLNSDPAGVDKIDAAYDSLGRVASVTNPYRSSSTGSETYSYDTLNRVTEVLYADTDYSGAYYGAAAATNGGRQAQMCSGAIGYPILSWDAGGNYRETWVDFLGRVVEVDEPDPSTNSLTSGNVNATCYTYNVLGNLTTVVQGTQTRSYTYDMLSRVVSATTPESGTAAYVYSGCSGDPSNVCTRTDARGVVTTYHYDALNRLTAKSYSDGTPVANFWYDNSYAAFGNWSVSGMTNTRGRLFATCTSNAIATCPAGYTGTVYSYDSMGRIVNYWQATPYNEGSSAWETTYTYDLAGDVMSWTHPAGFTITDTVNAAQEITQITSSLYDATHPQYLAKNVTYTPWGAEQTLENGCASSSGQEQGCTDTLETYVYSNRMQPVEIELGNTSNASADYCLVYNYYGNVANPTSCATPAQGGYDGGNVVGVFYQDSVNPSLSHTAAYTYDHLNRLETAAATGNATYNLTYEQGSGSTYLGYDRYGNMTCVKNQSTNGPCPDYSFNAANNQINTPGFTYDAAGDLTSDGTNTYQYDGEGRLVSLNSSSTPSWSYNAVGDRTGYSAPWATADVLFTPGGQLLSYWDRTYNDWGFDRFWLNGRMMAYYNPDAGTMRFEHVSGLDSATMVTDQTGGLVTDQLFYPWGEFWEGADTEDPTFASLLGDDRTYGLYPAKFREYTSNQGRWLSPDPLGGDITNPQSLNRYAYVLNNPTTNADPSGLVNIPGYGLSGGGGGCDPFFGCPPCDPWDITCEPSLPFPGPIIPPIGIGIGIGGGGRAPSGGSHPGTPDCGGDPTGCSSGVNWPLIGAGAGGFAALVAAVSAQGASSPSGQAPQALPSSLNACEMENLNAVNNRFGTGLTASNVEGGFQFSTGAPPGLGTLNLDISVPAQYQSYGISPGRYPVNWWTYIIGYGPTLHIPYGPGGLDSAQTLLFSSSQFTEHLDSAFLYNPIGALLHLLEDILGMGGYPACPR